MIIIVKLLLFNTLQRTPGVNITFDRYKSTEQHMTTISIKIIQDFKHRYFFSLPYFLQITNKKEFTIDID